MLRWVRGAWRDLTNPRLNHAEPRGEQQGNAAEVDESVAALDRIKQAYASAHEKDESREFWKGARETLIIFLTCGALVFTGLTYCTFNKQLDAMQAATNLAHQDAVNQVDAADRALAASNAAGDVQAGQTNEAIAAGVAEAANALRVAQGAAADAHTAFISGQRAFLTVRTIEGAPTKTFALDVQVVWRNSGTTPTVNLRNATHWETFDGDMPEDFAFPYINDDTGNAVSRAVIGPQSEIKTAPVEIPPNQVRAAILGVRTMYVYGYTRYDDVFGGHHRSLFCVKARPIADPDGGIDISYDACSRHYCTDTECQNYQR